MAQVKERLAPHGFYTAAYGDESHGNRLSLQNLFQTEYVHHKSKVWGSHFSRCIAVSPECSTEVHCSAAAPTEPTRQTLTLFFRQR